MRSKIFAAAICVVLSCSSLASAQTVQPADNPEMTAIYAADQAVREGMTPERLRDRQYLQTMIAQDAVRRQQTRALLDAGALKTGSDYRAAAFVFQHGSAAEDYLLAHSLAVAAVAKGDTDSVWIAAATLDRYLQMTGKDQIYGTQTRKTPDGPATLDPYNRALIPDSLRHELGVPTQAEQDARITAINATVAQPPT